MRQDLMAAIREMVRVSGKPAEALAQYHRAIRDRVPLENVAELREQVLRQVQEDFVGYARKVAP
jgi:hypothetical protein